MLDKIRLREAHESRWSSVWMWLGLFTAYGVLEGLLALTLVRGPGWSAALLVLILAHVMHVHLLAFHESAHGTLCPNRWVNDGLGVFIGIHAFISLALYRSLHHAHHAWLATERDDELWPFVDPHAPRWLRCLAAAAELGLGLVFTPVLFLRSFLRRGSPIRAARVRRRVWLELGLMSLFWAAVLAATAWADAWRFLFLMYLVPAMLAGNLQSLRKYIEHMGMTGASVIGSTRSVVPASIFGRVLAYTMFNISYHGIHHRYARMHPSELPAFTQLLQPISEGDSEPYPSYRQALPEVFASLLDPRIGAQWREVRVRTRQPRAGGLWWFGERRSA